MALSFNNALGMSKQCLFKEVPFSQLLTKKN